MEYVIRKATLEDAQAILDIYAPYIRNTVITFEYEVPSLEEFRRRMEGIMEFYPYLVCEMDGRIVGYAYAHRYGERAAFDWSAELSVYLDTSYLGKGIGRRLYEELIRCLRRQNIKTVYALVSTPNAASEALHEKLGFRLTGTFEKIGYKLGRWCDLTYYEKEIGNREDVPEPILRCTDVE